jgi:DNA-binding winged helix-turn-helix (wHTH) protein
VRHTGAGARYDPDMIPFRLDRWTVHPDRNELVSANESRRLEPKAMELLVRLAATPGVLVTKEELLRDVWHDAHVVEHVLPKTISALRKALGDDAQTARVIGTVPRRGYTLLIHPRPVVNASRGTRWAIAASLAVALFAGVVVKSEGSRSVALLPTRGADAIVARDAEDALAHDLTKFSCLEVTKGRKDARYKVESNVVGATLRTRLVDGDRYVAAIDTPAANGVVDASRVASAKLVKHVCKRR